MIVTAKEIYTPLEMHASWFSSRFKHVAKDTLQCWDTLYDINDLIAVCEGYKSNTRNPKQKLTSEKMMAKTLQYLKGLI